MSMIGILLALVALLIAGPAGLTLAQDGPNCNGLSEADCQILVDSQAAMRDVHAFEMPSWSLDLRVEAEGETVLMTANGSGRVALAPALIALTSDMPAAPSGVDLGPMIDFLKTLDRSQIEAAIMETGLHMIVDQAATQTPDESNAASAEILFYNGGLYVRQRAPNGAEAWFGEMLDMSELDMEDLQSGLEDMQEDLDSEETQEAIAQLSELSGTMAGLGDAVNSQVTTTREADQEFNGHPVAVFKTTFDLPGFLASPDLAQYLTSILTSPAMSALGTDVDLSQLNQKTMVLVLTAVSLGLEQSEISMEQWIGTEDHYMYKMGMTVDINLDMSYLPDTEIPPIRMTLNVGLAMDNFNGDVFAGIEAPAEFRPMDDTDAFLAGGPDMIEAELQVGQSFSGAFDDSSDYTDVYSLPLKAGDAITVEVQGTDGNPQMTLYGPDGFEVASVYGYSDEDLVYTATQDGVYLLSVENYWSMKYELIVRLQ